MRRFLAGLALGVATATAEAQDCPPRRPLVAPFYCPPSTRVTPVFPPTCAPLTPTQPIPGQHLPGSDPNAPPTPTQPVPGNQPGQPGTPTAPEPRPAGPADSGPQFSRATGGGGGDTNRYNVNMFADLLGARGLRLTYTVPLTVQFGVGGSATTASGGQAAVINPNAAGGFIRFGPTPNGRVFTANAALTNTNLSYVQPLTANGAAFDNAFARNALQTLLSRGELTAAQALSFQQLAPADRAQLLTNRGALNGQIARATNGLAVPSPTVGAVQGVVVGCVDCPQGSVRYSTTVSGEQVVPLPGAGANVGRLKMSEDNSPIPRDRVIFNYDSFGGVPLTSDGIGVNRFQFGVEKTFLDGLYSFEARLPFAGTLASSSVLGAETTDVEFGNVRLALKRLWTRNNWLNVSTGLGVTLPTAKDQTVFSPLDASVLYRYRNKSVYLEPFVGMLYTPNDRLFAQAWTGVNFDVSGGTLTWNRDTFGGSGSARYYDLPLLTVDGQLGYWLVRDGGGLLRGLAPFGELHWNRLIAQSRLISAVGDSANGMGLTVTGIGGHELNLSAGFLCQVGDNLNLSVGAVVPLLQNPDRTFNWQIGLRANYYFGRTARTRSPVTAESGF